MILLAIVLMLVLDILWISANNRLYSKMVLKVQKSQLRAKKAWAVLAYLAMVVGLVFIVLPQAKSAKGSMVWRALRYGGLFGLVLYTVYNATNLAIFSNYDVMTAAVDTLWGTFLFFIVTLFALWQTI